MCVLGKILGKMSKRKRLKDSPTLQASLQQQTYTATRFISYYYSHTHFSLSRCDLKCSSNLLVYIYINNNKMIQYARLFIIIIDTVGVQLRELLHNLDALVLVFLLRLQLILALVPLQTRVVE